MSERTHGEEPEGRLEVVQAIFSALVDMDTGKLAPFEASGITITPAERRQADELFLASMFAGFDQRDRLLDAMRVLIGGRKISAAASWPDLFDGLSPERVSQLRGFYDALPEGARAEYDRRYGHPEESDSAAPGHTVPDRRIRPASGP